MPKVKFTNKKKEVTEIEVETGANLRAAALQHKLTVHHHMPGMATLAQYLNCKGNGMCGTCSVLITKGMENCSPRTIFEQVHLYTDLSSVGKTDQYRLSCQVKVQGDIEVFLQPAVELTGDRFWEVANKRES